MIEWDGDGYPTEESLQRVQRELQSNDAQRAVAAFYEALSDPGPYGDSGPEQVDVRGELCPVWGYHTNGWSGCEEVIATLRQTWLWHVLLERYDRGGHYYFDPPERWLKKERTSDA